MVVGVEGDSVIVSLYTFDSCGSYILTCTRHDSVDVVGVHAAVVNNTYEVELLTFGYAKCLGKCSCYEQ